MTKPRRGLPEGSENPAGEHSHIDSGNWIDEPPRGGFIRTCCKLCGKFVGYRPVVRITTRKKRRRRLG